MSDKGWRSDRTMHFARSAKSALYGWTGTRKRDGVCLTADPLPFCPNPKKEAAAF